MKYMTSGEGEMFRENCWGGFASGTLAAYRTNNMQGIYDSGD